MSIWTYRESGSHEGPPDRSQRFELNARCSYCASAMVVLAGTPLPTVAFKGMNTREGVLLGCPVCGWWNASSLVGAAPFETHDGGFAELRELSGVLKNLNV